MITDDLCIFVREVFTICMTSISILYLNSFLRFSTSYLCYFPYFYHFLIKLVSC